MPHSVSPEAQEPDVEPIATDADTSQNGRGHEDEEDQDQEMALVQTNDDAVPEKAEVKLEELFADVESDEEFPSSNDQDIKMSSSPEDPASPMLVLVVNLILSSKLIIT